jgi:uncharacterized membrane protein YkoI
MDRTRLSLCALAAAVGLALATPALQARGHSRDDDHERARQALERGQVLPLRTVLERIEADYPGQVLGVEFEHEDGRFVYEIQLLQPDGRRAKLEVDATDGRVLKVKRRQR